MGNPLEDLFGQFSGASSTRQTDDASRHLFAIRLQLQAIATLLLSEGMSADDRATYRKDAVRLLKEAKAK